MSMNKNKELKQLKDYGKSKKERNRAHALLLNNKGYKKKAIAEIIGITQRSLFNWFDEYERYGISSLSTKKGQGRKTIIDQNKHLKIVNKYITKYPNQPKKAYSLTEGTAVVVK